MFFTILPYVFLFGFFVWSCYYLGKAYKDYEKINENFVDLIPSIFTTLGVFGTFIGIAIGLNNFNVNDIDSSIPTLLQGLKTAFYSSIIGIFLSLIFSNIIAFMRGKFENSEIIISSEVKAINKLVEQNSELLKLIGSERDDSLTTHLTKLRQVIRDQSTLELKELGIIKKGIGGDSESSLLTQITKLREDSRDMKDLTSSKLDLLNVTTKEGLELTRNKFDEFGKILEKSNTEALVKVIEKVIGGFNEKLNDLIEKLVKENFQELDNSVKKLNDWQKKNKELVEKLISQFEDVSDNLQISAESVEKISKSTDILTNDEGKLAKLIFELEKVMVENTTFVKSVQNLNESTKDLDNSSKVLKDWMNAEMKFGKNIEDLINSLEVIHQFRDRVPVFFNEIEQNMNKSVSIISSGNEKLMKNVNNLDTAFNQRLNNSFKILDNILQRMVEEYAERMN